MKGVWKLGLGCHIIERLSNTILIGYMRVSKSDGSQSGDLQRDALIAAGVDPTQIYEDRASGRLDARPSLEATLKALRPGDTLMVWKLHRLGRNLRHLVNTVHELATRGVGFKVLTGHGPIDNHHARRQTGVWHFCRSFRIRARAHL
jgi:DNA invertase Pin-like site-specific DNA recombinase